MNVRESRIIQVYQYFNFGNIIKSAIDIINETGGLQTIYGHNNISDYDYDNSNRIYYSNVLIRNITREYGGINPGSGRSSNYVHHLLIGGVYVDGQKGTCQCIGSGDISNNPTSILSHEISHSLYGSNDFHTSGGNHRGPGCTMPFLNIQGGYGLMGAANSGLVGCNGYERWRMHWKHPQAPDYITARNTDNTGYVSSDISREDGNVSFLLRDFVTYGDVVRIKLPYKDSDLSDNQYIWLENHQVGRNGKLDFLQYSNEFACRPVGAPGIYAYYQIGRDILSGAGYQVWDNVNRDNLKILPAEGYWDYALQGETEPYNMYCVTSDAKNYSIRRAQPNALNGYQDQEFKFFPQDEDNALHLSAEYPMWRKIVGDEVFDELPSLGDNQDAFSSHSKISMGTNPSTCNRATCHSDNTSNTPASVIIASNSQYDTKAIYLSGLSIEMTPMEGGDFRVDIRWDDYDIHNDARWTGTIVLNEQANLKDGSILTLAQNRTVAQTTRDGETGLFAPKTTLTCQEGSTFRQEGTSQVVLTENSELVLKSGSTFTVTDNAKLVVGNGCRLLVEAGASTSILDGGQLVVESGAVATIHDTLKMGSAANILVRPGGRLVVDGGVLTASSDVDLWEGIFVEGDRTQPQTSAQQGVVELRNGATIENVRTAISTNSLDARSRSIKKNTIKKKHIFAPEF